MNLQCPYRTDGSFPVLLFLLQGKISIKKNLLLFLAAESIWIVLYWILNLINLHPSTLFNKHTLYWYSCTKIKQRALIKKIKIQRDLPHREEFPHCEEFFLFFFKSTSSRDMTFIANCKVCAYFFPCKACAYFFFLVVQDSILPHLSLFCPLLWPHTISNEDHLFQLSFEF